MGGRPAHVGTGDSEVQRSGRAFEKVTEGVAREGRLEDEVTEIIGSELRGETFQIEVPHSADIKAGLHRMLAASVGEVVAELGCLRLRNTSFVPAYGRQSGAGAEVEGRKGMCCGMLTNVHASKVKLRQRGRSLNRKVNGGGDVGKTIAKFVQERGSDGVGMRDQQAPVMDRIAIVGKKGICIVLGDVLPAEAGIGRLLGADRLVEAQIGAIRAAGVGWKVLVVITRLANHIGQRNIGQQASSGRADAGEQGPMALDRRY